MVRLIWSRSFLIADSNALIKTTTSYSQASINYHDSIKIPTCDNHDIVIVFTCNVYISYISLTSSVATMMVCKTSKILH